MVTITKNKFGDIIAYIEWWRTDNSTGQIVPHGTFLYINDLYVCKKYRKDFNTILADLINKRID